MQHVRRNYALIRRAAEASMLQDMDNAVSRANMWDWLRNYEPPQDKGFMWDRHPNIEIISSNLEYDGHSGFSFAWTLRNIQFVARHGWDKYCEQSQPRTEPVRDLE